MNKKPSPVYRQVIIFILVFLIAFFGTRALFSKSGKKAEPTNQSITKDTINK